MNHQLYYDKVYELFLHGVNKDEFSKKLSTLDEEYAQYATLLNHITGVKTMSMEEIDAYILSFQDDIVVILYKEIKFLVLNAIYAKKYPKLFSLIKVNDPKHLQKKINKALLDEDFLAFVELGKDLIKSQHHPIIAGIALAKIMDRINSVDEAEKIFDNLYLWYPESELIKNFLHETQLQFYLHNEFKEEYKKSLDEITDFRIAILYRMVAFSIRHNRFYYIAYWIAFFLINAFSERISFILFLPFFIINLVGLMVSIRKSKNYVAQAFFIKLVFVSLLFAISALITLMI